uniref:Uncharacterized protein n=1 Tax=Anguilla anguilla TaxID=7936 RepID=A0A0E9S4U7_ANGAN
MIWRIIHPSISLSGSRRVLEPIPACIGARGRNIPWTGCQSTAGTHTIHSHTHTYGQFRVSN